MSKAVTAADLVGLGWAILIYGDWGAGKTVLACQATGAALIDVDPGTGPRSLLNHDELVGIPIRKCYTLGEAQQVEIDLRNDENPDIKTVILDTATSLQYIDMRDQMKKVGQKPDRDADLPSQAEFNINNRRLSKYIERLITTCNKQGRNVIVLCHDKEDKDKEGYVVAIRPGTTPALTQMIAPMFDAIFYLEKKATSKGITERTLKTVATNIVRSKNRFAELPAEIKDPHFRVIEEADQKQIEKAKKLLAEKELTNA